MSKCLYKVYIKERGKHYNMKRFLTIFFVLVLMFVVSQVGISTAFAMQSGDYTYTITGTTAEIIKYTGAGGYITIPEILDGYEVTSIGYSAFEACTGLRSLTIPNSVTSIDDRAFYACTSLTSATIPDSVTRIGDYVLSGCTGLTSVTITTSKV